MDLAKAAELYRLSADQGYPGGQFNLGLCYEHGKGGLAKDEAKAAELYRLAAAKGDVDPIAADWAKERLRPKREPLPGYRCRWVATVAVAVTRRLHN